LERITSAVEVAAADGGVIAIHAIGGMPGAGKTALGLHAAHLLRERFPDRQLFIDLHAHTPGREPVAPRDALAGLLISTGVDPRFLPADLDGRAALWRDQLAGQHALLVLDNAASSAQVIPLLPGGGDCLVLVTSRRHLGDLPGAVVPVSLDVLPAGHAAEMFTRLAPRSAADQAGVMVVVQLAGFLPLAVSLLARVFSRHSSWTLADLAAETRDSLLTVKAENDTIAAAFDVSYRHLNPARQRFFDLLGLHPGATIDSYAAAALAEISPGQAAELLDTLHGEGLVTETGHRRFGMHDLLRRYARDHATAAPDANSQQALGRLLDYYQHTAALAQGRLARQTRPGSAATMAAPVLAPALDDAGQALAWIRTERDSLLAALDLATRTGHHGRVIALTAALTELLRRDGPWADAVANHNAAVQAAGELADRLGQANILNELAVLQRLTGDYQAATHALEQALRIYHDLDDRLGQANTLNDLGAARRLTGDYQGAAHVLEQALGIYRDLGNRLGEANALSYLGDVRRLTGDYQAADQTQEQARSIYRDLGNRIGEANTLLFLGAVRRLTGDYQTAAQVLDQALAIYRDVGDRGAEAEALNETGTVYRVSGAIERAVGCHQQALELARLIASPKDEAHALVGLGRCAAVVGSATRASALLRQAHEIFQRIGAADDPSVLAELASLSSQDPLSRP
jgi:tetratricopeptide (TPR) repeat protein